MRLSLNGIIINDGLTFITDSTKVTFDNVGKTVIRKEGNIDQDLIKGQAFLQVLMNDFISR